jgi:organic hydroperoxide reductase OsmC/OhrA
MPATTAKELAIESTHEFSVSLTLLDRYAFRIDFDDATLEPLHSDEAPPLGLGTGPSPSRLLAAAVANCLASSLLFCLRRSHVEVRELKARATVNLGRNHRGRLRVQRIDVELDPTLPPGHVDQLARCKAVFEDYCTVTASIRDGITITASVTTAAERAEKP